MEIELRRRTGAFREAAFTTSVAGSRECSAIRLGFCPGETPTVPSLGGANGRRHNRFSWQELPLNHASSPYYVRRAELPPTVPDN
ncbi:hypothetical protein GCM10009679_46680 [Saccharothrix algeriensis]|uniref:Uncharacterized protein n=1 Tax=Catellatospora bangladeshensis TaxID=310355 RepID=A0A8J3JSX1_9ACTN|nr:hypothetical protein Cba03nite_59040 [Catellatospora bangladeshensis]